MQVEARKNASQARKICRKVPSNQTAEVLSDTISIKYKAET